MKAELDRRQSHTNAVLALFLSRPLEWISWQEIAKAGGDCAWRTRISDARKKVKRQGGMIEWNRKLSSAYRYKPYEPLGRDSLELVTQKSLW